MSEKCRTALATIGILVGVSINGCGSGVEEVQKLTSPDGKWSVSEEYYSRSSNFCIILRTSKGKEIAKHAERHVESYLIDLPSDHRTTLEITNESAGEKGHPIWRLDQNDRTWHPIYVEERPVKTDAQSTP